MDLLQKKIVLSELIIKDAVGSLNYKNVNILWSGGKDSTTVLHIIKKMYGSIPFTVTFADCTYEFDEVYKFIDSLSKKWNLKLDRLPYGSPEALERFEATGCKDRKILVKEKALASKEYIAKRKIKLSISGIRWYEHFHKISRFKGKYKGLQMAYPILHWTHQDVWNYIRQNNIPYIPLYDQGYSHIDLRPFSQKDGSGVLG